MSDVMIDIEALGVNPDAMILTIAAQAFDPLGSGWYKQFYYTRISIESQPNRVVQDGTIEWASTQPEIMNEALAPDNRIPLDDALKQLHKMVWQSNRIWANGINYDLPILEHAYKSYNMPIPWQYYRARDARTIYSLYPDLPKPPTTHHALEDCRRQIKMLQESLKVLNIKVLK